MDGSRQRYQRAAGGGFFVASPRKPRGNNKVLIAPEVVDLARSARSSAWSGTFKHGPPKNAYIEVATVREHATMVVECSWGPVVLRSWSPK